MQLLAAAAWAWLALSLPLAAQGLELEVESFSIRCVGEDMAEDALGKFSFHVSGGADMTPEQSKAPTPVKVTVFGPSRGQLYAKQLSHDVDSFSFTSHEVGLHKICFKNGGNDDLRVSLDVQTDLSVKDYSEVVKTEHLQPLGLLFRKAEDKLQDISLEMDKSREREAHLRETSESTARRIEWFSILSITVLLTISAWQIFYLKSFFRSKKLL